MNIKADGVFRMDEQAFNDIFVKNEKGDMVPVNTLITLKKVYGPESVQRYNLYNSLNINVSPKPGVSNGELMDKLEQTLSKATIRLQLRVDRIKFGREISRKSNDCHFGLCLLFCVPATGSSI